MRDLMKHPMYTASDLAYFREKGYSDEEILAFWDRDHARGKEPLEHRPVPDVVGRLVEAAQRKTGTIEYGCGPTSY